AFQSELAGIPEYLLTVGFDVLNEHKGFGRVFQQRLKQPLALDKRGFAQVVSVEIKQVEGVIAYAVALARSQLAPQLLEIRQAVPAVDDCLAIDNRALQAQTA